MEVWANLRPLLLLLVSDEAMSNSLWPHGEVIILQDTSVSNQRFVHLRVTQSYMLTVSQ